MRRVLRFVFFAVAALAAGFFIYGNFFLQHSAQDVVEVRLTLQDHKFDSSEVRVPAGKPFVIYVKNNDATPEDAFFAALRLEKFVAPRAEAKMDMRALRPGRYELTGEYHPDTAKTVFIVE